jgi:hypothetical protein
MLIDRWKIHGAAGLLFALVATMPTITHAQYRTRVDRESFRENFERREDRARVNAERERSEQRQRPDIELQQSPGLCLINPELPQCSRNR